MVYHVSFIVTIEASTSHYGEAFEHFIILECHEIGLTYFHLEYRFYGLKTKDDAEINLVVERPGCLFLLIEIKSSTLVGKTDLTTFIKETTQDFGPCEAVCFCNDILAKKIENVRVMPWQQGLIEYFGSMAP